MHTCKQKKKKFKLESFFKKEQNNSLVPTNVDMFVPANTLSTSPYNSIDTVG